MNRSLRTQLQLWLSAGIVVLALAQAIFVYATTMRQTGEVFDHQLEQTALIMLDSNASISTAGVAGDEFDTAIRITHIGGTSHQSGDDDSVIPMNLPDGFAQFHGHEGHYRAFTASNADKKVTVAQDLSARTEIAQKQALQSGALIFLFGIGLLILLHLTIARAMMPLTRLREAIRQRQPHDLSPISTLDVPREVLPLANETNELLGQARTQIEMQQAFVADAAHELRTPLTALQLQLEVLRRSATEAERLDALSKQENGLRRARDVIDQLLAMARADSGTLDPERFDMREVIDDAVKLLMPSASARNVLVDASLKSVVVSGSRAQLTQLACSLLDNAIKFATSRVAITLNADTLSIEDDGPGIEASSREKVFGRFHRVDPTHQGTGLGLPIAQQIARKHGTDVVLGESTSLGGAKVSVSLKPFWAE